jgi:hypothetical protein
MSLTSSRLSFTHRCTISRDVNASTTNARGNPSAPNYQPLATGVLCRAWTTMGAERVTEDAIAAVEDMRLLLPIGTDVTERDRIGDITERGATYFAGPIGIRSVIRQRDHLELILVRIAG